MTRPRNKGMDSLTLLWLAALLATVFSGCSSNKQRVFRYSTVGEPSTLDMMGSIAVVTGDITSNIYEGLFAHDSHFIPQLSLAQSYKIEDQGLRCVIALRRGVLFHDGQEMISGDVIASLNRWMKMTAGGHTLFRNLAKLEAPDRYTIVIHLKKPMSIVANLLAVRPGQAAIYPKSVIDAAGEGKLKDYIGTGPYKFVSWHPNQYIELDRFDRYVGRTEPADGMAGRRETYLNRIHFIPVPNVQQRLQGVQTGLYDFAFISPELYASVGSSPIETKIVKPYFYPVFVFNKKQGMFSELKMRQAVQASADFQPMLQAAFGDPDFYRLDPSLNFKETKWWSDAGKALYNQNNPARAKELLAEARYRGETVRILTTQDYFWMYKLAVVLKSQLEAAGMKVQLDVEDWPVLIQRWSDPGAYDIYTSGFVNFNDPGAAPYWDETFAGWWSNPLKDSLMEQLATEPDDKKRLNLASQFQQLFYEDVPMLKVGDSFALLIWSREAHGPGLSSQFPYLFNSWLSK